MMVDKLDDDSKRVLQVLNDGKVVSGSQLVRSTALEQPKVQAALETLNKHGLISYTGDIGPSGLSDAFITVRPSARDASDFMLKY